MHNTPPSRKLFDNKEELKIGVCLRIMDLSDGMKEPKWYPIIMDPWIHGLRESRAMGMNPSQCL